METKHTPGPWETIDGHEIWPTTGKNANCSFCFLPTNSTFYPNSEIKANAKLIAAAPELLDNLKRIVERIEENDLQNTMPSAYKRAKEAIQKAEG